MLLKKLMTRIPISGTNSMFVVVCYKNNLNMTLITKSTFENQNNIFNCFTWHYCPFVPGFLPRTVCTYFQSAYAIPIKKAFIPKSFFSFLLFHANELFQVFTLSASRLVLIFSMRRDGSKSIQSVKSPRSILN